MSRMEEWEEELVRRFPSIDCHGVSATAKFITILEEMGGFDEGAYLNYHSLSRDINIICRTPNCCEIAPVYVGNQLANFRCIFFLTSRLFGITKIEPTSTAIRDFLSTQWLKLFPKESML